MEMSYNQMQPQAIVSELNSKASSIKKNTNIIHLSLLCVVIISGERDTRLKHHTTLWGWAAAAY